MALTNFDENLSLNSFELNTFCWAFKVNNRERIEEFQRHIFLISILWLRVSKRASLFAFDLNNHQLVRKFPRNKTIRFKTESAAPFDDERKCNLLWLGLKSSYWKVCRRVSARKYTSLGIPWSKSRATSINKIHGS